MNLSHANTAKSLTMKEIPMKAKQSYSVPTKAASSSSKHTTTTRQHRRFQRRNSKTAFMIQTDCSTIKLATTRIQFLPGILKQMPTTAVISHKSPHMKKKIDLSTQLTQILKQLKSMETNKKG